MNRRGSVGLWIGGSVVGILLLLAIGFTVIGGSWSNLYHNTFGWPQPTWTPKCSSYASVDDVSAPGLQCSADISVAQRNNERGAEFDAYCVQQGYDAYAGHYNCDRKEITCGVCS